MNRLPKHPLPAAVPLRSTGPASPSPVGVGPTYRCPDCDGPFSDRIRDEDTGCSYPVDDGEHYCGGCDAIWSDEALGVSAFDLSKPEGWSRVEL